MLYFFEVVVNYFVNAIPSVTDMYDYVFSENGLVAYKDGKLIGIQVNRTVMLFYMYM